MQNEPSVNPILCPSQGLCKRLKVVEDGGTEAIVVQETLEPQDVVVALDPYVAVGKKQKSVMQAF